MRRATCTAVGILALLAGMAAVNGVHAEAKPWTVPERSVPAPAAASDELRNLLLNTPAPDLRAAREFSATSAADWNALSEPVDAGDAKAARDLAKEYAVTLKPDEIAGVSVHRVTPISVAPEHEKRLFIHLHGGAYVMGAGEASLPEAVLIAHYTKMPVLSIDYRMPPQHPFPAAVEDVVSVYRELLKERSATSMALGGTSAGGGLAMASTHKLIELGEATPAALFGGTPWVDLTRTGDTHFTNEGIDRVLVTYDGLLEGAAKLYAGEHDLEHPLISPLYGEFKDFPPTYLVSGTRDLFLSDTVRTHRKLRVSGVVAELNVYEGMSHADYTFLAESPETQQIYGELRAFLSRHLQ